jgi:hypothetical protein
LIGRWIRCQSPLPERVGELTVTAGFTNAKAPRTMKANRHRIQFAVLYFVCCLLPPLTVVVLVRVSDRLLALFPPLSCPKGILAIWRFSDHVHTSFLFPWRPILAPLLDYPPDKVDPGPLQLHPAPLLWVLSSLWWGLVLFYLYRLLKRIDGLLSARFAPEPPRNPDSDNLAP